jgi:hypothetical protein
MGQVSGKIISEENFERIRDQEPVIRPNYLFVRNWSNLSTLTKQQMCI